MNKTRTLLLAGAWMAAAAVMAMPTGAQTDYSVEWRTIDGGGEMSSTGGDYELSGTIGQPDAGQMVGGAYNLTGGFWFGCMPADCNCDGAVDLNDFVEFEVCFQGPGGGLPEADCACFDFNADADIDLLDFAAFQDRFGG